MATVIYSLLQFFFVYIFVFVITVELGYDVMKVTEYFVSL